jgi:transcriptional regulator with XRE-family HTH domain
MSQIPAIIKSLRASPLGLSQTEIARRTGIPQPRISRWEGGDVAAGADDALKLVALAKEFGVYPEPGQVAEGQGA